MIATPEQASRILVIDDDQIMLLACRRILEKVGFQVETCDDGLTGLERIQAFQPRVLIVDLRMPGLDGFQVIERARALDQDLVIVVITGFATITTAVDAMKSGAFDFVPKPFTPDELRMIVRRACERWSLVAETKRLRREKEEAERRFVTFVSHQLKSPLADVKQYLDVLVHTDRNNLNDTARNWIGRARVRLQEMMDLILDWLTLAKVERGTFCDPAARTDLAVAIQQVLSAAATQAEKRRVALRSEGVAPPLFVRGDPLALTTVIGNLVVNAIKYNREHGDVAIRTTHEGRQAIVEVEDTGIGIPSEALPQLFTEFYRVRTEETQDIPGTGLGLAICNRIVTHLGGTIEVRSTPGKGTVFSLHLPVADRTEAGAP